MPTFGSFLVSLVAASSLVAAAPATSSTDHDGVSVAARRNEHFRPDGPAALARAYRKFGKPLPLDLARAVSRSHRQRTSTGSVVASSPHNYDVEYLAPVQIGTPAQTLPLNFDTGSSDLWVFSTLTPPSEVNGQKLYDPSKSSSSHLMDGESWNIVYGDGSSSGGSVYSDVVSIGGLAVQGQAVEVALQVSQQLTNDSSSSGLVGLAFSSINTVTPDQQNTFFANAMPNLNLPLFTADLNHHADGTYNFGFIDKSHYTGSITYTPVDNSQGFWGWTSTGYAVGSDRFRKTSISGIADTGTTLLLLPDSIVKAYYAKVPGAGYNATAGGYSFNCSASLPTFKFGVEKSAITIPGSFFNFATLEGSHNCYGGLQSSDGIGINVFGDIALKAAFVVFDGGKTRLGWASKRVT
ncbi:uncharacterized protein UV8b_02830 [Ustilaginoidea virens]|uniref:Peptidase A1 domain-containing protein n=1 Tax=Ustilaginoidea virens TaxID=1159556 RepID=A0A063BRW5_USTVR|nr:uncharacterized protein UV8b_02830 [Ustilaginoidea virens]QUC18589.1 hypothetical protein UV8b_02830 [Ustilaginoidea virens]GAO18409.1 hypothetical protein UVI_02046770 [Ustilaginoidea virens]